MKTTEFRKLIREEIKKTLREEFNFTIPGNTIQDTGGKWPQVMVSVGNDTITISQEINEVESKVILSKNQFKKLIKRPEVQ